MRCRHGTERGYWKAVKKPSNRKGKFYLRTTFRRIGQGQRAPLLLAEQAADGQPHAHMTALPLCGEKVAFPTGQQLRREAAAVIGEGGDEGVTVSGHVQGDGVLGVSQGILE